MSKKKTAPAAKKKGQSAAKLPANKFWAVTGRNMSFPSSEILQESCIEYLEWAEDNPLYKKQVISYQGEATLVDVPLRRVPTHWALWHYLGIDRRTWYDWRDGKRGPEFARVVANIDDLIHAAKFEGAAVDIYNSGFIAKDLGMAERQDHISSDGSMTPKEPSRIELVAPDFEDEEYEDDDSEG